MVRFRENSCNLVRRSCGSSGQEIVAGKSLDDVFPGISAVHFTTEDTGLHLNLRIATKEGIPISLVPEGTPNATVVGVKRVDELGFYNLSHQALANKLGVSQYTATAAIAVLSLKEDPECSSCLSSVPSKFRDILRTRSIKFAAC